MEKVMKREYKTEKEIVDLVRSFEDATIAREDWKHAEHLIVALYYLSQHDLKTATAKIRSGIFNLLVSAFAVDLTIEMPYHETLTVFWMRTINDYVRVNDNLPLWVKANEIVQRYDKDYPLRFYSREFLFSDEARAEFREGDLLTAGPASVI
jgi:hypothetical protein